MGRDDPYRRRPWFIGRAPLIEVKDIWSLEVQCMSCGHRRTLGRLNSIRNAHSSKTQGEFVARLTCSRCGERRASVTVEFVGKRRD